jgi:trk system potassium uptake protein TrkA
MYVVVVGCGRVGSELALRLFRRGHEVAVVDPETSSFENLSSDYRGRTITGSLLSEEVARRAELGRVDGLAVVTSSDTVNAVVAHAARSAYGVANIVVRNFDPRLLPLHRAFRLRVVSSTTWGAARIESLLHLPEESEGKWLLELGAGELVVTEVHVTPQWEGLAMRDLMEGLSVVPMSITREGQSIIARWDAVLAADDVLHVTASVATVAAIKERLSGKDLR